jgi:hypothetical protein
VSFADSSIYLYSLSLLTHAKFLALCSLPSDDDDPKRDAMTAPLLDTLTVSKTPSQEAATVVKSPESPAKKGTHARASKCLKKAAAMGASLDTHRPVASPDDVSIASYSRLFYCLNFSSHAFLLEILMKKFLSLGTECVEFLKAARASQGMPVFVLSLILVPLFLVVFYSISFSCFGL